MLNPWNDLIKQESNNNNNNSGIAAQNPINMYTGQPQNENDANSLMLMGGAAGGANSGMVTNAMQPGNGPNGLPSQAQVAAAVATAMMMQNNGHNNMGMHDDDMDDDGGDDDEGDDDDMNNDAEGVWSPDIEQSFQEALAIYPPCGRRKIILSEEGKMYGRNELIARYIKVRTGKSRSRKQVSSHIQVLAKRKTKDFHSTFKDEKSGKQAVVNGPSFANPFSHLTSAQIISPAPLANQPNQQQQQQQQQHNLNNAQNQQNIQNNGQNLNHMQNQQQMNQNMSNQQMMLNNQQRQALTNSHNTHNHHHNQQQHHPAQMLQNCTNILPNNANLQNSTNIWSHPGLQPEKKARIDLSQNLQNSMPCSASSPNSHMNNQNSDELIPSSSSSSASSVSNHHNLGTSPESGSPTNHHHMWPLSTYNKNESNALNKCIVGLQQLRLVEFSGFLEQRHDPDFYNKHLFVHLNTSDYNPFNAYKNDNVLSNGNDLSEDFELIHYKDVSDKFPESDLLWSLSNEQGLANKPTTAQASATYLIKFWVDLNYSLEENVSSLYAVTNIFESPEPLSISCSTKVCSFGNQVVEKVETEHARYETNNRYAYRIENSPMCEYMITFINKLKQLPEKNLKNSVLENFSVLQLIKNNDTQELLLTLAYVFEVSTSEHGAQHNVYKLTNK